MFRLAVKIGVEEINPQRLFLVRVVGLEPTRLAAQEPKGDVTTVICFCLQKIDDYLDPKIT